MREHPIPQDITGYRFHLVGSMTLKQFAMVLLGAAIAFVFYKTNLPGFIKWPLSLGSFGLGFAAAFVPIEERPLDHWIIAFFKTLYKPTKFYWKKEPKVPDSFLYKRKQSEESYTPSIDTSQIKHERIKQFLQSVEPGEEQLDEYDLAQQQYVDQILQNFQQVKVDSHPVKQPSKPDLKTRTRKISAAPKQSIISQGRKPNTTAQTPNNKDGGNSHQTQAKTTQSQPKTNQAQTQPKQESKQKTQQARQPQQTFAQQHKARTQKQRSSQLTAAEAARQSQDLPFPNKPTKPNRLVGMVITPNQELVNDALIEVKNKQGKTIIAAKSNALGQFTISQPLPDGEYLLEIKKQDHQFKPQKIELDGSILQPFQISSINSQANS